jgi:hypothetical protein
MRPILIAAATALGSMAGGGFASAHYCPGPAANFSAYYYQSPGGIRRARGYAHADAANAKAVPYPQSCGKGRVWRGDRCVRE